jgi:hypothetical protein
MHISPASFEQLTPFPYIPLVHCTFTLHLKNLPVNFRQTKIFSV